MSRPISRRRGLVIAAVCGAIVTSTAFAATPDKGSVSNAAPHVEWKGSLVNSYIGRNTVANGAPCEPQTQTCDIFTLTVADPGLLTITADAPKGSTGDGSIDVYVKKPDGSTVEFTGTGNPDKPLKGQIKNAPKGDYEITYVNNFVGPSDYTGTATLGAGTAPAASPTPAASATPAPANPPKQDFTVSAKTGKASAKKLTKAKKLVASITVSHPVTSIAATFLAGKKQVGSGAVGATSGTAKVPVKLKGKIKKGTYTLKVVAKDSAGTTVTKSFKVKVGK